MAQSINELLQAGMRHHQAGELAQAEAYYRQALQQDARNPDGLRLLGLIALAVGRADVAAELIGQAVSMRAFKPDWVYDLGVALKAAGKLNESITAYRNAISLRPNHLESHFNLAVALQELGDTSGAIDEYANVTRLNPQHAEAHFQTGVLSRNLNRSDAAIAAFQAAVAQQPNHGDAWLNLGLTLHATKKLQQALPACRRAVELQPDSPYAHNNLAAVLRELDEFDEAVNEGRTAIALKPDLVDAHVNLANALHLLYAFDEAEAEFGTAIRLDPRCAEAYSNLGTLLQNRKKDDEAIAAFRKAIAIRPNFAAAHANFASLLCQKHYTDQAMAECQIALSLDPNEEVCWHTLGNIRKDQSLLDEAIAALRHAIAMPSPHKAMYHANLLMTMLYPPELDPQVVGDEHMLWDRLYTQPLAKYIKPLSIDADPDRRLRMGYLSGDFREHVVARFMLPILANHDHSQFEIFIYANIAEMDKVSEEFRSYADHWQRVDRLSDDKLADMIRQDRIDILIDTSGHTGDNRLKVFARKPAPVQVSYLGYPTTTGLKTIDYRITDGLADPPGMTESYHAEKLVRLPRCNWAFRPPDLVAAAAAAPPRPESEPIVFGCFTNIMKVNRPLIELWGRIMQQVPDAKLVFKAISMASPSVKERFTKMLIDVGVEPDRMQLIPAATVADHLKHFDLIDIFLDTFPYHGTTTTCETMWMGVPVVTLAGKSHVSRVGVSLLTAVGVPELIAQTPDEYVQIAADLARDRQRLTAIRMSLRDRMINGPLGDGVSLARAMEDAYRQMWREWCGKQNAESQQ